MSAEYWILKCDATQWVRKFSEMAHLSSFGEYRPKDVERIDFALVVFKGSDPGGYVTCIEFDRDHVYWQIGGVFENYKRSPCIYPGLKKLIAHAFENYKMISARVVNENLAALHICMKLGFRIVGTFTQKNRVLVELVLERPTEVEV